MPHKHRRRRDENGDDVHDLPPTALAKPLAVTRAKNQDASTTAGGKKKTKENPKKKKSARNDNDDTPKAFTRLMQQMQIKANSRNRKSGAQDGQEGSGVPAQRKQDNVVKQANSTGARGAPTKKEPKKPAEKPASDHQGLRILPGERLSEFSSRVNQTLPLSGVPKKKGTGGKDPKLRERRQTKHEKKLRRLQTGWREEEARIREREEERQEEMEEKTAELEGLWRAWQIESGIKRRYDDDDDDSGRLKKKKKRRRN